MHNVLLVLVSKEREADALLGSGPYAAGVSKNIYRMRHDSSKLTYSCFERENNVQ